MLGKAQAAAADRIIIDLEDAVAAEAKREARALVVEALVDWQGPPVTVRVNAPRSPWCHGDIEALASLAATPGSLDSLMLPKTESAADLGFAERLLDGVEAAARHPGMGGRQDHPGGQGEPYEQVPLALIALVESAAGLARLDEIARSSEGRLAGLVIGYADLAASLDRSAASDWLDGWLPAQNALLVAARANGLLAIDGPYLRVDADAGFKAAARRAHDLGFDGKWAIHPRQLPLLNQAFTPSSEEVERARRIVAALTEAESGDRRGAIALDGEMIDEALRASALKVLARAGETGQAE